MTKPTNIIQPATPVPVSDAELGRLIEFACGLADAAGHAILPHFRAPIDVQDKSGGGDYDPVTAADRGAESAIRALIEATYPEHGIFGEEHGYQRGTSTLTWVIDPIDGTRSFITGALHWGTLIALHDGMQPILGVMNQPYTLERFVGSRLGAELRRPAGNVPLRTRACARLGDAALYCTARSMFTTERERAAFDLVAAQSRLVRYGGDCYNFCMIAHGLVDVVVEAGLAAYDVQALIPIIEAAGGIVTTWLGEPAGNGGRILAAGNPRVHAQALEILRYAA